jgi:hypothetical protein
LRGVGLGVRLLISGPDVDRRRALSLLASTHQGFRPAADRLHGLARAFLAFTDLAGKTLAGDCSKVHLAHANLQGATFSHC